MRKKLKQMALKVLYNSSTFFHKFQPRVVADYIFIHSWEEVGIIFEIAQAGEKWHKVILIKMALLVEDLQISHIPNSNKYIYIRIIRLPNIKESSFLMYEGEKENKQSLWPSSLEKTRSDLIFSSEIKGTDVQIVIERFTLLLRTLTEIAHFSRRGATITFL